MNSPTDPPAPPMALTRCRCGGWRLPQSAVCHHCASATGVRNATPEWRR